MGKHLLQILLWGVVTGCAGRHETALVLHPVEYVNPLMGTGSDFSFSAGNTYPAVALPWGMNFWTPQTGKMGDGWIYTYDAKKIRGLKQTHQPSPWINDYGQFSLFAMTGRPQPDEEKRASWFSHMAETAQPHYYKVYLADYDVTAELTPTERAAFFRFTFPAGDSSLVLVDAFDRGSMVRIHPDKNRVAGYTTRNSGGVAGNFKNWFVVEFDRPFTGFSTWNGTELTEGSTGAEGFHAMAFLRFNTRDRQPVHARVASSFISAEQALCNLKEIGNRTFEQVRQEGYETWDRELGRIRVTADDREKASVFYSCLYRVLLFPRKFYEFDAGGGMVHYSPYNGQVVPGLMYTDNGFWDTFRALFPFLAWMYPAVNAEIMEGLVNAYLESGWLPEWASPGHRDCMIGSSSASLVADSRIKGIRGYRADTLYAAILKNTLGPGPVNSVGRLGASYYNELGYVPYDVGIAENAARTLEYAYADFCISVLAENLGRPAAEIALYRQRAENYRHLFDPSARLMRGRNSDGSFAEPFNPFKWGDAFTEGNSWHYTWSVFHDAGGLARLMGGRAAMASMLDSVFRLPPLFDCSYYGFPIHEIREMQVAGMGNYAHGNQPAQHMIYLYNHAGESWKAQQKLREVMTRLYRAAPDGYCGDEDNGQTSAWYVFSALGFYPVCPGTPQYVVGSPLFEKAVITLPNGEKLTLRSKGASLFPYIRSAKVHGNPLRRSWLSHDELTRGGSIVFRMDSLPDKQLWSDPSCQPFSMSQHLTGSRRF